MNEKTVTSIPKYAVLSLLSALSLSAVARPVADGVMSTLVEPGKAGTCVMAPCQVFFKMPATPAEQRLRVNGFDVGTYAAGEVVNLGDYNDRTVRIQLPDADYPLTLVHIPSDNGR